MAFHWRYICHPCVRAGEHPPPLRVLRSSLPPLRARRRGYPPRRRATCHPPPLRVTVWTWRDQIIDGRHRARACDELGMLCRSVEYEGDEAGLVPFVVSLNLHRRHLDESQRAMVAARLANLPHGVRADASIDASAVTQQHAPIGASVTQDAAADMLSVGRRSVQRARAVIDSGAPELVQAVERGEVSVSAGKSCWNRSSG